MSLNILSVQKKLILDSTTERIIKPDGTYAEIEPPIDPKKSKDSILPKFIKIDQSIQGVVRKAWQRHSINGNPALIEL